MMVGHPDKHLLLLRLNLITVCLCIIFELMNKELRCMAFLYKMTH